MKLGHTEMEIHNPREFDEIAKPIEMQVDEDETKRQQEAEVEALRAAARKEAPPDVQRLITDARLIPADARVRLAAALNVADHNEEMDALDGG